MGGHCVDRVFGRHKDFQRQYKRNPARCHRRTVSGLTMVTAFNADGNNRQSQTKISRSATVSRSFDGTCRRSTFN
jgi:hypothetical protein